MRRDERSLRPGRDTRPPRRTGSERGGRAGSRAGGRPAAPTSWDPLATWYNGWVGEGGSEHHRQVAVPAVMRSLQVKRDEHILDIGCGQGVLAPAIAHAGAHYLGIDASPKLLDLARKLHGKDGQFVLGDARKLSTIRGVEEGSFDAVVFLLSLQDMDPLDPVLSGTARALRPGGRVVLLLTHPSFRVPRQSGWGWDDGRKLVYRRVDRYLTPLPVPLSPGPKGSGIVTRSFHRSIGEYVNALASHGLLIDRMDELPGHKLHVAGGSMRATELARKEIPLFLSIRAVKA